jgi:hypothetical protein
MTAPDFSTLGPDRSLAPIPDYSTITDPELLAALMAEKRDAITPGYYPISSPSESIMNLYENHLLALDTYTWLHLDLDEQAQDNYVKLQGYESKAMAIAKAENATFKDRSGRYLLNLRMLGLFYIMVHAKFCRRSLQDVPIALTTGEVAYALEQVAPHDADLLSQLGEKIRFIMAMCAFLNPARHLSRLTIAFREDSSSSGHATVVTRPLARSWNG